MAVANNSASMKQQNRLAILRLLRKEPLSRAELARRTGLTRAAVSIIAENLLAEQLICESKAARAVRGRAPTLLTLNPAARYAVGVDVSREGCFACVCDFTGAVRGSAAVASAATAEETVDRIAQAVGRLMGEQKISSRLLCGVGVCIPGPVNTAAGVVLAPPGLELWHGFALTEALEKRLSLPVFLQKDTDALALAEQNRMPENGDFLYLLADNGLGCSHIKNGAVSHGFSGFGGELGHISICFDGPVCRCGNRGCAELYTSIPATVAEARRENGAIRGWQDVITLAEQGDALCRRVLTRQARLLSVACVSAVNLLEPDTVVLGGALAHAPALTVQTLQQALSERCMTRTQHRVTVRLSEIKQDARLYAAANLALHDFFRKGQEL